MPDIRQLTSTYLGYLSRTEVCTYSPTRVWVEASSRCNLQCSFCGNSQLPEQDRGFMDLDLFRGLADEASGRIRQFNMFHRGESLLHPRISEMVRYARDKGIRTRIHTNGTVLGTDLSRELIQSGLGVLSISFDGYDKAMYESNRKGACFESVLTNVMNLLHAKKEMGAREPFVAVELMEISDYPPDVLARKRLEFVGAFRGLPLDKFVIRRPHNWGGLVEIDGTPETPGGRIACPLLWHALVVYWDGRVMPCPQDFFGALQLGNAREQSLAEIWNGEPLRELRREMRRPRELERSPCAECDRIVRSTIAGVPTDYLGRFLSENLLGMRWIGRILPH